MPKTVGNQPTNLKSRRWRAVRTPNKVKPADGSDPYAWTFPLITKKSRRVRRFAIEFVLFEFGRRKGHCVRFCESEIGLTKKSFTSRNVNNNLPRRIMQRILRILINVSIVYINSEFSANGVFNFDNTHTQTAIFFPKLVNITSPNIYYIIINVGLAFFFRESPEIKDATETNKRSVPFYPLWKLG